MDDELGLQLNISYGIAFETPQTTRTARDNSKSRAVPSWVQRRQQHRLDPQAANGVTADGDDGVRASHGSAHVQSREQHQPSGTQIRLPGPPPLKPGARPPVKPVAPGATTPSQAAPLSYKRKESTGRKVNPRPTQQRRDAPFRNKREVLPAPEDDDLVAADSDEDVNVASLVAKVLTRDAELEASLAAPKQVAASSDDDSDFDADAPVSKDRGGVVNFMRGSHGKRRRIRTHPGDLGPSQQTAKAGPSEPAKQVGAAPAKQAFKPGELSHAGTSIPEGRRPELFGGAATTWEGLGLSPGLSQHLHSLKFELPTRVQQQAIPSLLAGRDVLVQAPTGSGKTLCYLAALLDDLAAQQPRISRAEGSYALVLAPTRELAIQIQDVLGALLRRYHWLVAGLLIGGENRAHEKARLRKGVTILVATPGRLLDHLENTASFLVSELKWLIMDEADRLLDLGFEQKIAQILKMLDSRRADPDARRQAVLLSATLHNRLGALASVSLLDPVPVGFAIAVGADGKLEISESADAAAGVAGERFVMPSQLRQLYCEVPCKLRLIALVGALRSRLHRNAAAKVVVFASSCDGVDFLHRVLTQQYRQVAGEALVPRGATLVKLHGDMVQGERTASFVAFCQAASGVLLCTDVAARGLDFPAVTTILQFDPPGEASEYVHRVGRTARMGQQGDALLFLMPQEVPYVQLLTQHGISLSTEHLAGLLRWLPPPTAESGAASMPKASGRFANKDTRAEVAGVLLQRQLTRVVAQDKDARKLASDAFRSFVRAYATHPSGLKDIFHVRRLHLGHVAHAFALAEPPSMLGSSGSKEERRRRKHEATEQQKAKARRAVKRARVETA